MSFRFKQFYIEDSQCAMKVGTDGVLLGAWCPITNNKSQITNTPVRVLDVGTGSGLIARMLMQRCPEAEVEGIDIDEAAVKQARENGVNAFCSSLQDWPNLQSSIFNLQSTNQSSNRQSSNQSSNRQSSNRQLYDLIVSNPPYFQNSLKNPDKGRMMARHTDTLSYEELIEHSVRLLHENGQLALILPADAEKEVRRIAEQHTLFCTRVTRVYSKNTKPARRVLLAFSHSPLAISFIEDSLVLEDEKGGRSAAYSQLCQEFYL